MKSYAIETLISPADVQQCVRRLARNIAADYEGQSLLLVCILNGSCIFTADLARELSHYSVQVELDFMKVSSYEDSESSGSVKMDFDMSRSITGRNVLIVEDIIDTGRTLEHLLRLLHTRDPRHLSLCCLLDKPSRRVNGIQANYVGQVIEDHFVVGYGLDYNHRFRELPYIGILNIQE